MSNWQNLFVPGVVLKALQEQGFSSPTPIQGIALPHAIRDRLDIVGAAETVSHLYIIILIMKTPNSLLRDIAILLKAVDSCRHGS